MSEFTNIYFSPHRQTFQGSHVGCGNVCLDVQESLLQLAGRTTEIGSTFFGADGVVAGDAVNASMVVRSFVLVVVEEDDFAVIQSLD